MRWSSVTVAVAVTPAYRLSNMSPAVRIPLLHKSAKSTAFCSRSPWLKFLLRRVCIACSPAVGLVHTCNARSASRAPRRAIACSSHCVASCSSAEMDRYSLLYPPIARFFFCSNVPSESSELYAVNVRLPRLFTSSGNRPGSESISRHSACAMAFCSMMCSTVYSSKDRGSLGWLWFSNPASRYLQREAGRYRFSPSSACLNSLSVGMRVALAVSVRSSAAKVSAGSSSADSSLAINDGTSLFSPLLDTEQIIRRNRYDSRSASMRSSPSRVMRSCFHAANMYRSIGSVTVLSRVWIDLRR